MISYFESDLTEAAVHHVGNQLKDEYLSLSEQAVDLDDDILRGLLLQFFIRPFEKNNERYKFYNENDRLELNDVWRIASDHFEGRLSLLEASTQLARHLFASSSHPNIKAGELYVVHFDNMQLDGQLYQALGVFKSESKEAYLKVKTQKTGLGLSYEQEAININKLDKGCLIFNTDAATGFQLAIIDHTNRSQEAQYWKDDFLKVKIRNNDFNQTDTLLGVYKSYVTKKIDEEFEVGQTDKIDLLNRSMKYFKDKEVFDLDEFTTEVIGNEQGIASFLNYKKNFEDEFQTSIADSFEIHDAAVKKQARSYKSVLKLDKNFHIYIHGDKELIEKGFDEEKHMSYYKVYFQQEE